MVGGSPSPDRGANSGWWRVFPLATRQEEVQCGWRAIFPRPSHGRCCSAASIRTICGGSQGLRANRRLPPATRFSSRATSSDGLYIVVTGILRIYLTAEDTREATINLLEDGEVIGEMGLLDGLPRSAGVAALDRREADLHPARAVHVAARQFAEARPLDHPDAMRAAAGGERPGRPGDLPRSAASAAGAAAPSRGHSRPGRGGCVDRRSRADAGDACPDARCQPRGGEQAAPCAGQGRPDRDEGSLTSRFSARRRVEPAADFEASSQSERKAATGWTRGPSPSKRAAVSGV